jgi:hypothetical protein
VRWSKDMFIEVEPKNLVLGLEDVVSLHHQMLKV